MVDRKESNATGLLHMILLITLLTIKHFICDFLYQPPYMWQNKGTYGHIGGILHSTFHASVTFFILSVLFPAALLSHISALALGEFIIHYHMDWFKMNYNKKKGWGPTTHNEFWVLLGVDQLVHSLTYIAICALV
jgi:hypothetical protein